MSREVMEHLAVRPEGVYLDATAGLGGHLGQIAQRLTTGFVIANDRDTESMELAKENTRPWTERIRWHHGRLSELGNALAANKVEGVDGLLADLGVSRYQLTDAGRGFSLTADSPLDMRMDRTQGEPAGDLVNQCSEKTLADWIYQEGEEWRARRIARAIVRARPVRSCRHLADIVAAAVPRTGKLHPATLTFQALRRVVNDERGELAHFLERAPAWMAPGGRLVVISFMSLEDRMVKQAFQRWAREGVAEVLTRKVVTPGADEVRENPAARSGKLRAAQFPG